MTYYYGQDTRPAPSTAFVLFLLVLALAWWGTIGYVTIHFLLKWW